MFTECSIVLNDNHVYFRGRHCKWQNFTESRPLAQCSWGLAPPIVNHWAWHWAPQLPSPCLWGSCTCWISPHEIVFCCSVVREKGMSISKWRSLCTKLAAGALPFSVFRRPRAGCVSIVVKYLNFRLEELSDRFGIDRWSFHPESVCYILKQIVEFWLHMS